MIWTEKCLMELTHHNVFESSQHRLRFRDLVVCYYNAPFFCKALCKCMYLTSWDDVYFADMLALLNDMTIDGEKSPKIMGDQYEIQSIQTTGRDSEVYRLCASFITGFPYIQPDFALMDSEDAHMIRQALAAAGYIDDLPEPHSEADTLTPF